MKTAFVWVLSFTVLGATPEHKEFPKYPNKEECERALAETKAEYQAKKKRRAGHCRLVLK